MYGIASSTSDAVTALTSTGSIVALIVASILGGMVGLMGVGYAVSKIKRLLFGESRSWVLLENDGLDKVWQKGKRMRVTRGGNIKDEWYLD